MREHPRNLEGPDETAVQFEYVSAIGSNIPMFEAEAGVKMTFPEGKRVDPMKAAAPAPVITFETPPALMGYETKVGLYTKTLLPL